MRFLLCGLLALLPYGLYAQGVDGRSLSPLWGIPFALILLSVAIMPLISHRLWGKYSGWIVLTLAAFFVIPFAYVFGLEAAAGAVIEALIEYVSFILLLLALYTVSGGILVWGNLRGTPRHNVTLLLIGTLLASLMGTTGAAMLMVRPLIRANEKRRYRVHQLIFLIFLVANIGGGLTPIGDPPLFLGFLHGVDFFWTLRHAILPVGLNVILLLLIFYVLDRHLYRKEGGANIFVSNEKQKIRIYGKFNFILLAVIVVAVVLSGVWNPGQYVAIYGKQIDYQDIVRDGILMLVTLISYGYTPKQVRNGNEFDWGPIREVAELFLAIFITIVPVLLILKAGFEGAFSPIVSVVTDSKGAPLDVLYFWITGLLSSFLDNAPTYLVFFNLASGDAAYLMQELPRTLLAISTGAVFMGAFTYIGNAPNLMVKFIAEQRLIVMPNFVHYMLWSVGILMPIFLIDTLIFFSF
jgi:hypothetical protein